MVQNLPCFKDLIAVLFECFLIISLGYLSRRFKLISPQVKDLNSYLTTFALPMIIFLNIAQMEFKTINVSFLVCMLSAKLIMFVIVSGLTLTISYPRNFGFAGALSILTTQSNDFALGYPLIKSLYGDSKPEMLNYLSLMAPIQLLILNPLGIMMLEYHKSKQDKRKSNDSNHNNKRTSLLSQISDRECKVCSRSPFADRNSYDQQRTRFKSDQIKTSEGSNGGERKRSVIRQVLSPLVSNISDSSQIIENKSPPERKRKQPFLSMPRRRDVIETGSEGLQPEERQVDAGSSPKHLVGLDHSNDSGRPTCSLESTPPKGDFELPDEDLLVSCEATITVKEVPPCTCVPKKRAFKVDLGFLKALAMNPLIIASVVALITNLTYGPELPKFVTRTSNTIAASFAAPALYVVGASMFGNFELMLSNPNALLLSSVLVLAKVLILPNLMRTLTLMIVPGYTPADEVPYLIDFSFLYGHLPTAPTACIIAKQYGVLPDVISISMLLSTFTSAPLMLAASAIINPSNVIKVADIERLISQIVKVSSVMTFSLAFLTLYAIWKSKDNLNYTTFVNIPEATFRRISHFKTDPTKIFLLLLSVSQAMIGVGGIIWCFVDSGELEMDSPLSYSSAAAGAMDQDLGGPGKLYETNEQLQDPFASQSELAMIRTPLTSFPQIDPQTIETIPIHEPFETWQVPQHMDFSLKTIFAAQYVFSSSGLMMSKFVILCLIIVIAAKQTCSPAVTSSISRLFAKLFVLLGASILLWLTYDSDHSKRIAIEPSLPSENGALYVRLAFNVLFLCISMPMFALIIREDNKRKLQAAISQNQSMLANQNDDERSQIVEKPSSVGTFETRSRCFINSSGSLSSSETNNTNVELTSGSSLAPTPTVPELGSICNGGTINKHSRDKDYHCIEQLTAEPASIVLDGEQGCHRPSVSILADGQTMVDTTAHHHHQYHHDGQPKANVIGSLKEPASDSNCNHHNRQQQQQQATKQDLSPPPVTRANEFPHYASNLQSHSIDRDDPLESHSPYQTSEFNRYSILIVFMLIDSTLNLTSITQKLIQDQPSGTFRQVEVISVALEFGQGILTFLIYGMGRLLK